MREILAHFLAVMDYDHLTPDQLAQAILDHFTVGFKEPVPTQ